MHVEKYKCTTPIYILTCIACIMKLSFQFFQRPNIELMLVTINYNIKLWNSKVQKLKNQQEIIKHYLTNSINNLQITNKRLQKMEIFMANAHANPKLIDQIMDQSEKEQELSKSLSFMIPSLKLLSTKHNLSFVYKLFGMVNDPDTNSVMIWNKSGTSFFIKDEEGLQDHVKERFDHTMGTFYRKLSEFGFKCVDKFLCEYANENFQRDNEHMLKNIKSMRKLLAVKRNMKSDMEEELKRLKFFQNELKNNISNYKENEQQTTKCDMFNVKRCLQNASKTIECSPSTDSQSQAYGRKKLKQDGGSQPWLNSIKTTDIGKIKQDLYILHVQIVNLEQDYMFVDNQLAAIERIFPGAEAKQKEIELSVNKLFMNRNIIPKKRSRTNKNNEKLEIGTQKARAYNSEHSKEAMNKNDHIGNKEELTTSFDSQEPFNIFNHLMENVSYSDTDI